MEVAHEGRLAGGPCEGNQLVEADFMYNGLFWPKEDFIKVTVERDLAILIG